MDSSPSKSKSKNKSGKTEPQSADTDSFDTMEKTNLSSSIVVIIVKIIIAAFIKFWRACTAGILILLLSFWLYGSWISLTLLVVAVLGLLYNAQDMLLYHPNQPDNARIYVESPATMGLPYENVFIKTNDGERINLLFIKQPQHIIKTAPTVIFFHGNAGNIGHRLMNAYTLFTYCGMNVVLAEYRGFGKSSGRPSESGLYRDAQATLDYVSKRTDIDQSKLVIFGRSLGGAVAIYISSLPYYRSKMSGMIIENTFTSLPDIAKYLFDFSVLKILPTLLYKNKYPSAPRIKQAQIPTLFLSGLGDTLIPPRMMQGLFDVSGSPMKRMARFEGGTHNETWQCVGYYDAINRFISEVVEYQTSSANMAPVGVYRIQNNVPFHDGGVPHVP